MRFIVDLFRYIIVLFCGLALVGSTLLVIAVLDPANAAPAWLSGGVVMGVVVGLVLLVLNLGVVTTLIFLHDRHCDLVDEAAQISESLQRLADGPASRDASGVVR